LGTLKFRVRGSHLTLFLKCQAQVVMGGGIIGRQPQNFLELFDRLTPISLLEQGQTQIGSDFPVPKPIPASNTAPGRRPRI
jgi:uncharacterized heparinase superfamily protein